MRYLQSEAWKIGTGQHGEKEGENTIQWGIENLPFAEGDIGETHNMLVNKQ